MSATAATSRSRAHLSDRDDRGRSAFVVLFRLLILRFRDRLSDRAGVWHVGHRELRLIASGRDLDGPDAKDAVEKSLRHMHGTYVLERDRGAVLAQDASAHTGSRCR